MNPQKVTKIISDLKAGLPIPRKTKQVAIGFLQNVQSKHKNAGKVEEEEAIKKAIEFLNK